MEDVIKTSYDMFIFSFFLVYSPQDITWLHTRAFKNNVSELGTYLEFEGLKCTYFSFTWCSWKHS